MSPDEIIDHIDQELGTLVHDLSLDDYELVVDGLLVILEGRKEGIEEDRR